MILHEHSGHVLFRIVSFNWISCTRSSTVSVVVLPAGQTFDEKAIPVYSVAPDSRRGRGGGGGGGRGLNSVFTVPHSFLGDWGHFVCMYVIVQAAQENHCTRIIFPVPGWTSGSKIRYRSWLERKIIMYKPGLGGGGGEGGQYLRGFKLEQLGYSISVRRMLEHAWMNFTESVKLSLSGSVVALIIYLLHLPSVGCYWPQLRSLLFSSLFIFGPSPPSPHPHTLELDKRFRRQLCWEPRAKP